MKASKEKVVRHGSGEIITYFSYTVKNFEAFPL
jgi:hypothetical protein